LNLFKGEKIMRQENSLARMANTAAAICLMLLTCFAVRGRAQVAGGGNYTLNQSVIASGGGASSAGVYKIEGVIGQPAAGTTATNSPFTVRSGFFTPDAFAPTAAGVAIAGRVRTKDGRGVRNVRIMLTEADGTIRTAMSGTFGYYNFTDVSVGQVVILNAFAKKFSFGQPTQVLNLTEDVSDIDFIVLE
jgi:hypothetical protein